MIVLGLDSSLTSTGVAHLDTAEGEWITRRLTSTSRKGDGVLERARRMRRLAHELRDFIRELDPPFSAVDVLVIEGLASYGRNADGVLPALWWRFVDELDGVLQRPPVVVAPATRAKYAAGDGGADKSAVLAAVRETYPSADVPQHDVADAVALAALGARIYGFPVEEVPRPWVAEVAGHVVRRLAEKGLW